MNRRVRNNVRNNYQLKPVSKQLQRNVRRFVVTANVVPSSPILVTLMMEAIRSFKMFVLTRTTGRHFTEDDNLHI
jgi:hypothetical protein